MLGKVRSGIFHFIITGSQQRLILPAGALARTLRPSHLLPATLSSQQRLFLQASALARMLRPFHLLPANLSSQQRLLLPASALARTLRSSHLLPANLSSQQRLLLPASALARTLHPSHLLPTIFKTHIQHLHKRCNEPWHGDVAEHSFCNSGCMILQVAYAIGATSFLRSMPRKETLLGIQFCRSRLMVLQVEF